MLKILSSEEASAILSPALEEIKSSLLARNCLEHADTCIIKLTNCLEHNFSLAFGPLYTASLDEEALKSLSKVPVSGGIMTEVFSSIIPPKSYMQFKKQYIYPYPIAHLGQLFFLKQQHTVRLLPYLLAAYYIHFRKNAVIDAPYRSSDLEAESLEYLLFADRKQIVDCPPINTENYMRTVNNFCKNFSLDNVIYRYAKRNDIKKYLKYPQIVQAADITSYLNGAPLSVLHYRSQLYTWIYAMCTLCCTQTLGLSEAIDYVSSTNLFYTHTLAFETRLSDDSNIKLSDFFIDECAQVFSETLHPDIKRQLQEMGVDGQACLLPPDHTDADVYKCSLLILSAMFHPSYYYLFQNANILCSLLERGSSKELLNMLHLHPD